MRRFKFTKMLLSIFAVVVSISGITAEDVYLSIDRSAITPTRHEEMIKKLPASVSVITKEDIKMSNPNQTTVPDQTRPVFRGKPYHLVSGIAPEAY